MKTAPQTIDAQISLSVAERAEVEFRKDIWDVRYIPGVHYEDHRSLHLLNFTAVPSHLRATVKSYYRFLLASHSLAHCQQHLCYLRVFFSFFLEHAPQTRHFRDLTVSDLDAYLMYLKTTPIRGGKQRNERLIWLSMKCLDEFLRHLQRVDSSLAPSRPLDQILWPEHRGVCRYNAKSSMREGMKYLTQAVLAQLDQHLPELNPRYLPVVVVLRASGWRISDVLHLRHDNCLVRTEQGWFLQGDIQKTKQLGHRVPITNEVATLIQAQCELVRQTYSEQQNPKRYLFLSATEQRAGRPIHANRIGYALNRLAKQRQICDEDGSIFHFKSHAFRHTKAVELINNGMPLVYVQQWLAHLSPEMTVIYARILDTSMRRKWEEAMAQGAVRIDVANQAYQVSSEALLNENGLELAHVRGHLDSIRLSNGYCFKHKTFDCPAAKMPCYTCPMFVTTPEFLPQFEQEVSDTEFQIELGKAAGRVHWIEANERKLTKLIPIRDLLRSRQTHQPMGKSKREYTLQEIEMQQALQKEQTANE